VRVVDGQTVADQALASRNVQRRIALVVPHFLVALFTALETDLCFTLALRIAHPLAKDLPLAVRALPFDTPGVSVRAFWHGRMKDDPMHQWLRSMVFRAADSLLSQEAPAQD